MEMFSEAIQDALVTLGGIGLIVTGLSAFLAKIWTNRIISKERHVYDARLEEIKDQFRLNSEQQLARIQSQIDISKEAHIRDHIEKLGVYRSAVDVIVEMVGDLEMVMINARPPLSGKDLADFEKKRLKVYAYLAMHASQSVMDAHDRLTDTILSVVFDHKSVSWEVFRGLSLSFLNEVRQDIGIKSDRVFYNGKR